MQSLCINQLLPPYTTDIAGAFRLDQKTEQVLLLKTAEIQFAGGSPSQMLITSPLNSSQLSVIFTPLEQVDTYFEEKFILNMS